MTGLTIPMCVYVRVSVKLYPSTKATEAILAGRRTQEVNRKERELKRKKSTNINRVEQKQSILGLSGC